VEQLLPISITISITFFCTVEHRFNERAGVPEQVRVLARCPLVLVLAVTLPPRRAQLVAHDVTRTCYCARPVTENGPRRSVTVADRRPASAADRRRCGVVAASPPTAVILSVIPHQSSAVNHSPATAAAARSLQWSVAVSAPPHPRTTRHDTRYATRCARKTSARVSWIHPPHGSELDQLLLNCTSITKYKLLLWKTIQILFSITLAMERKIQNTLVES